MDAINTAGVSTKLLPVRDTLFFKLQGDDPAIKLTAKTVQAIVKKHGSDRFEFASTDQEAEDLWQNRKYALTSTMGAHPGTRCWTTDVWLVNFRAGSRNMVFVLIRVLQYVVFRSRSFLSLCTKRKRILLKLGYEVPSSGKH